MQYSQTLTEPKQKPKTKSLEKNLTKLEKKFGPNLGLFEINETHIFLTT